MLTCSLSINGNTHKLTFWISWPTLLEAPQGKKPNPLPAGIDRPRCTGYPSHPIPYLIPSALSSTRIKSIHLSTYLPWTPPAYKCPVPSLRDIDRASAQQRLGGKTSFLQGGRNVANWIEFPRRSSRALSTNLTTLRVQSAWTIIHLSYHHLHLHRENFSVLVLVLILLSGFVCSFVRSLRYTGFKLGSSKRGFSLSWLYTTI